jgi:hypothetical protein
MGSVSKTSVFKARKATFTVETIKNQRLFTAVNKRAHTVARKAGKRSKLTLQELRSLKGTGSYKFYAYTAEGVLKPIRF